MAIGIVQTGSGPVKGVEFDGDYAGNTLFKGIPYAAPPVGDLRWRAPIDPEPWTEVRVCDTYGPAAVQTPLADRHAQEYYFKGLPAFSEDCLYLNVTTGAEKAGEKRPVYMWFHGGGLTNCYSYEEQFNAQEMAKKGVIVVTVGQRLSLFGYLALPQLSKEQSGRSGNYGFMDQLKALDWVTENIAAFGGDPDCITVGGQSGGCTKAAAMAATAAAGGRVKRVISQSGLKMMCRFKTLAEAEAQGIEYLKYAGIDPNLSLDELRRLPTYELFRDAPRALLPGDMVCDGELVPFITMREGIERYARDVDFMSGSNWGEMDVFVASKAKLGRAPVDDYIKVIRNEADFHAHFRNLLGSIYDEFDGEHTLDANIKDDPYQSARWYAVLGLAGWVGMNFSRNVMLNRMFGMRRRELGHTGKTYTYLWTHLEPCYPDYYGTALDPNNLLAWHSSELWFVFKSLRPGIPPTRPWRALDFEVAERMNNYWVNFIKTGDPNGNDQPFWPASDEKYGWMELGGEAVAHTWEGTKLEKMIKAFVKAEYAYNAQEAEE